VRRLFLTAVLLAVTPAAATSSADRPLLTYAVTPMSLRAGAIPMGLCATDLQGNTFRLSDPHYNDRQGWSPDGLSIAFAGPADPPGEDHGVDLLISDPQGRHVRDLTRNGGRGSPLGVFGWSPDSSELGGNWAGWGSSVFIAKADGTGTRLLAYTNYGAYVFGESWSPDGSRILLSRSSFANGVPAISVINADGTNEQKLVAAADRADWSPDGRQFAYVSYADGRANGLGVAQADGSNAHLLLQGVNLIGRPTWSPDGSRLAYVESSNGTDGSLGVVRADGSDPRLLTNGVIDTPQWSPDGTLIAFTRGPAQAPRVAVIKPDGSGEQDVAGAFDPVWRVPAPPPSDRRPCIARGTSRADVIRGSGRGDVIFAAAGNDRVYGGGGDDVLVGGPGRDRLYGDSLHGDGNDVLVGGLGSDRLYGRAGADFFIARDRIRDFIFGGPGNDSAWDDPVDVLSSIEH
jgi:Tol biopolymer transport system component